MSFIGQDNCEKKQIRFAELDDHHIAALRSLEVNPAHAPVDGMCLDELRLLALIRSVADGNVLTTAGRDRLRTELSVIEKRQQRWKNGACLNLSH